MAAQVPDGVRGTAVTRMLIFDAKKRVARVVIAGVATFVLADVLMFVALGVIPDNGVRAAILVLSGAPLIAMFVYALCYVTRIEREEGGALRIYTLAGQPELVKRNEIESASYNAGEQPGDVSVNAPWITLRVRERTLPFVIDMQAEIPDRSAFDAVIRAR